MKTILDLPESNRIAVPRPTRPFYWSVWREIWENRSLYIAPLIVAGVVIFGMLVTLGHLPQRRRNALALDPAHMRAAIEMPYGIAALMVLLTACVVGFFYCLDALYGERRDRSILFWKSLPVSDLTSTLAKASIPLLVLPVISFVTIVSTQFIMLLLSTIALAPSGMAGTTWANFNILQQSIIVLYSLVVIALWHAPIYGWALLVSSCARRATFLWAIMPFVAIRIFEKITFGTNYVGEMVQNRIIGFAGDAFSIRGPGISLDSLFDLTPGRYATSPGLWIGLAVAAAFVFAASRIRRYGSPI